MALNRGEIRDSNGTNLICPFDAAAPNAIVERWLMMGDQNSVIKQWPKYVSLDGKGIVQPNLKIEKWQFVMEFFI